MSKPNAAILTAAGLALALSGPGAFAQAKKPAAKKPAAKTPAKAPAKAAPAGGDAAAIGQIEKLGGRVGQLAQNDDHLEVSYHLLGATINDSALAPVKSLKKTVHLDLGQTGVTDAGVAQISGLTDLTALHLEGTKITDKGLSSLKPLKSLTYLNLYGTGVTDAGLDSLTGLTNLKHLYVWQTKVTPAGVEKLKKALPQLEVVSGFEEAPKPAAAAPAAPTAAKK